MTPRGYLSGTYTLTPRKPDHWWSRTTYDFRLDPIRPLTYIMEMLEAQPDRHFITDGGSIPKLVQVIPAFDATRYCGPYGFHDSAYKNGWWFVRPRGASLFEQRPITRAQADLWLWDMLIADGATPLTAGIVYRFVRMFGSLCWHGD